MSFFLGFTKTDIKRFGSWSSDAVVEKYIENSRFLRRRASQALLYGPPQMHPTMMSAPFNQQQQSSSHPLLNIPGPSVNRTEASVTTSAFPFSGQLKCKHPKIYQWKNKGNGVWHGIARCGCKLSMTYQSSA